MKLHFFIFVFAAAIMVAQGYRSRILDDLENFYDEEALEAIAGIQDEPVPNFQERLIDAPLIQEDSENNTCDCDVECDKLHVTRLPHDVRVSPMTIKNN